MLRAPNRCRTAPVLAILFCSIVSTPALAQPLAAISTFFDPSIESSGMGYASVAVPWQDDLNDWANPALLGYQRGIRYSRGKTQLVPDLADDVFFTSDRFAVGACGLGVSLVGKPIDGLGKLRLDYGLSEATDVNGNVIGTFDSFEEVHQIGVGMNVLQFLENVTQARGGRHQHLSRYADLSLGHTWKSIVIDLAPAGVTLDGLGGRGEAHEKDRGALLRVTPVGAAGTLADGSGRIKLDVSGAFSQRNYGDATISFIDVDNVDPISEERLVGAATRLSFRVDAAPGGIWDLLSPLVSVGGAWEEARYYSGEIKVGGTIHRTGQVIDILGLVSLRHGFVDDPRGEIQDDSWGYSVGLQYRGIVAARYDWAEIPQSSFLTRIHREGFTVQFDPYRLYRATRASGESVAAN